MDGRVYLDFSCGGEMPLGYNHPAVCAARGHFSVASGLEWPDRVRLMRKLAEISPGGMNRRVMLCDSGREALSRAVSLACVHTGRRKVMYLSELESDSPHFGSDPAAVVVHPLDYRLVLAAKFCKEAGALLIDDETGIAPGATGSMLAIELSGVRPDVYVLGRGLAAGMPFGACITSSSNLRWPVSGSGGTPAACSAALRYISLLETGLVESGRTMSVFLRSQLEQMPASGEAFQVAGSGLCLWLRFSGPGKAARFVYGCRKQGLLLGWTGASAVAFLPPLVAGKLELETGLATMKKVLTDVRK